MNIIKQIIKNLRSDDNSVRLNGLKLLRLLAEEHNDVFRENFYSLSAVVQEFLQDNSRVVRQAALKLAAFLAIKLPFHVMGPNLVDMLETTYQFHEHCLKVASISALNMLDECQSALGVRSRITSYDEYIYSYARYACSLLDHSSVKISKKNDQMKKGGDDLSDSSDALLDSLDGLFSAHDSAIDLMALCAWSIATVDAWKAGSENHDLYSIRKVPASVVLSHLLEATEASDLHKNAQTEIVHRMKSFHFPSLTDEIIDEITAEVMRDLLSASSTSNAAASSKNVPAESTATRLSSQSQDKAKSRSGDNRDNGIRESFIENEHREVRNSSRPVTSDKSRRPTSPEKLVVLTHHLDETPQLEKQHSIKRLSRHASKESIVTPRREIRNQEILTKVNDDLDEYLSLDSLQGRELPKSPSKPIIHRTLSSLSADLQCLKEEEEEPVLQVKVSHRAVQSAHATIQSDSKKDIQLSQYQHPPSYNHYEQEEIIMPSHPLSLSREALVGLDHLHEAMHHQQMPFSPNSPNSADPNNDEHRKNYSRAASSRMKRSRLKQPPANFKQEVLKDAFPHPDDDLQERFSNIEITDNESLFASTSKNHFSLTKLPLLDEMNPDQMVEEAPKTNIALKSATKRKSKFAEPAPPVDSPRGKSKSPRAHERMGVQLSEEEYYHDLATSQIAEGLEYVDTKDLEPMKSPSQEFQKAIRGLETQEWPELFHTLTSMRRVVLHHPQVVLSSGALHSIVVLIMKQVENLRSSMAKNALITIADFFLGLKKGMDSEVQSVVPAVMKRSADSSNFLGESADRALDMMIENVTASRSLASMLAVADHKSPAYRAKVAGGLLVLAQKRADDLRGCKEFETFKHKLPKMLQDQAPESRSHAREIIKALLTHDIVTKAELENYMTSDMIEKALREQPHSTGMFSPMRGINSKNSSFSSHNNPDVKHLARRSAGNLAEAEEVHQPVSYSHSASDRRGKGVEQSPLRGKAHSEMDNKRTPIRPRKRADTSEDMDTSSYEIDEGINPFTPSRPKMMHSPRGGQGAASNPPSTLSTPIQRKTKIGAGSQAANAAKRIMESDPELMNWQQLLIGISTAKVWNEKKDAITKMSDLMIKFYSVLNEVGKLETCLEGVLDRLTDGSTKVCP